jgi:hypothetical protein
MNVFAQFEGRRAWQAHGVTGESKNPHPRGTTDHVDWLEGFSKEMNAARFAALDEAVACHRLSVRDNAKDRMWAERLS